MDQRRMLIPGLFLFIVGCLTFSSIAILIFVTRSIDTYSTILPDSPINRFQNMRCPYFVNLGDTIKINATIQNPIDDALAYTFFLKTDGFITNSGPETLHLQGKQKNEVSWMITATEPGKHAIIFEADSNQPGGSNGFPLSWLTSYRQRCSIFVITGPFPGLLYVLLSLICACIGGDILISWLSLRIKQRRSHSQ